MSWFEEQIKQRIENDNEMFTDAVAKMVNLVSVEKIIIGSESRTDSVYGAVCDILKYFRIKPQELPDDIPVQFLEPLDFHRRCISLGTVAFFQARKSPWTMCSRATRTKSK